MTDQVRRIFIDSRLRTATSNSNADFSVDLPFEVAIPAGTEARIDGLLMSHSWPSIQYNVNDQLFLEEKTASSGGSVIHRLIRISEGTYSIGTLADEIQTKLRTGSYITDGVWNVTFANGQLKFLNTSPTALSVLFSRADLLSKTTIDINWTFPDGLYVASTNNFPLIWAAADVIPNGPLPSRLADACEIIGLLDSRLHIFPSVGASCNHIDLARHKALYLCSNSLPSTSMDLRGRSDIIRQIIVGNAAPGEVVVDTLPSNVAFASFPSWTILKHLNFQIRDHTGDIATLYGHQISFVIELLRPIDR